jgi:hypothetical protein
VTSAATAAVANVNDAPTVTNAIADQKASQSTSFSYVIPLNTFNDLDGDTLTYSISGLPSGLNFDPVTRVISGTPTVLGAFSVAVTANDGHGGTASSTFTLSVPVVAPKMVFTNLLKDSQTLDTSSSWANTTNSSLTANATTAPDGTQTAEKLVPIYTAGPAQQRLGITNQGTFAAGEYTLSVYAKAGEWGYLGMSFFDTAYRSAVFDLNTGAASVQQGGVTTTATAVGNGWWRLSISATTTATLNGSVTGFWAKPTNAAGASGSVTADGTSGVYLWGAQLESGLTSTAYIPTSTASVSTDTTITASELANGFTVKVDASQAVNGNKVELGYLDGQGAFQSFATPIYSGVLQGPSSNLYLTIKDDPSPTVRSIANGNYALASRIFNQLNEPGTSTIGAPVSFIIFPPNLEAYELHLLKNIIPRVNSSKSDLISFEVSSGIDVSVNHPFKNWGCAVVLDSEGDSFNINSRNTDPELIYYFSIYLANQDYTLVTDSDANAPGDFHVEPTDVNNQNQIEILQHNSIYTGNGVYKIEYSIKNISNLNQIKLIKNQTDGLKLYVTGLMVSEAPSMPYADGDNSNDVIFYTKSNWKQSVKFQMNDVYLESESKIRFKLHSFNASVEVIADDQKIEGNVINFSLPDYFFRMLPSGSYAVDAFVKNKFDMVGDSSQNFLLLEDFKK